MYKISQISWILFEKKCAVLCNYDHFLNSTCRLANQTCPALSIPTSHFGLETSHGLYPRRPGSMKRQRDIHGFFAKALERFLCLWISVCSQCTWSDVWKGKNLVPNTLTIYILLISNLITCEFISACILWKNTSSLSKIISSFLLGCADHQNCESRKPQGRYCARWLCR